jgi:hypothetical protein
MSREMQDIFDSGEITDLKIGGVTAADSVAKVEDLDLKQDLLYSVINVAKTGADFNTIQAAIDYAVATYPSRSFNNPVVITVAPGEYREQINSYVHIIIQSAAAAYDPVQGQAKATIIGLGTSTSTYPLRTDPGDVYYMLGIAFVTDTADSIVGRIPEGTFKHCSFWSCHFIENAETTVSQFKDCKFGNNTYGGWNIVSAATTGTNDIIFDRCIFSGIPTFKSTHAAVADWGYITSTWSQINGSLDIAGDWGLSAFELKVAGTAARNTFDTTGDVKFEGGYQVNGMHFVQSPGALHLASIAFESIEDNQIPSGEADITAGAVITGRVSGNIMHNGLPSQVHMDNPDKFVGSSQVDGYMSVKAALDSITDNDIDHRYTIAVSAGSYTEDNPLQGKEYVHLKAIGDLQTTRIIALNASQDLITMADLFTVEGFTLWGVTGAANYAVKQAVAGLTSLTRCLFGECTNGVSVNHISAAMTLNDCTVYNTTATTIKGLYCQAGNVNANTFRAALGNITTLIEITGVNSIATLSNIQCGIATVTTAIAVKDLAEIDVTRSRLVGMATGMALEGGSNTHVAATRIGHATVDGVRINNVGSTTVVAIVGTAVENSTGYDFNLLSATGVLSGSISSSLNNINSVAGSEIYGSILDLEEDDEGVNILGELHVGTPEHPAESVFGEGDSYTRGLLAYTWDGAAYADISTSARSPSASSFTFPNNTIGTAIYIASDLTVNSLADYHKYFGLKMNILTAQVGGTIIGEYYNGAAWVAFNHMVAESSGTYYRGADKLFTAAAGGYQLRFDPSIDADWTKTDNPSVDTNDRYWIRFRITGSPSVLPIFEQFKIHSNRHEINSDGFGEDMGKARAYRTLPISWNTFNDAGSVVADQNLWLSTNCKAGFTNNTMTAGDSIGAVTTLPNWVDTSAPLVLRVSGVPVATGDYTLTAFLNSSNTGDVIDTSDPSSTAGEVSEAVLVACTATEQEWWVFELDISDKGVEVLNSDPESIWISIEATTVAGTLYGMQFDMQFLSWRSGSHI